MKNYCVCLPGTRGNGRPPPVDVNVNGIGAEATGIGIGEEDCGHSGLSGDSDDGRVGGDKVLRL